MALEGSTRRQLLCGLRPARGAPMAATGHNCIGCIGTKGASADLPAVRGDVRPRDPRRGRPGRRSIRGDRDDVWSEGLPLPEGHDARPPAPRSRPPPRADGPRRRRRGARSTWDEAFARCDELLAAGDRRARHRGGHRVHRQPARRTTSRSAATSACSSGMSGIPIDLLRRAPSTSGRRTCRRTSCTAACGRSRSPDVHRTDLLVVMGANPHASQGSLLACPDVMGELDAHPARGGKVIVDRPAPHRHRRPRRRVAADHARHRRRAPARGRATCCSPRSSSTSATVADLVDGVDDGARRSSPSFPPEAGRAT